MLPEEFTNLRTRMDTGFRVFAKNSREAFDAFLYNPFSNRAIHTSFPQGKFEDLTRFD